jgi:CRISPR-associated protein Csx17
VVRAFAYAELVTLFSEGRLEVGRRRARSGLDTARAIATLGIDRGSNVSSGSACS